MIALSITDLSFKANRDQDILHGLSMDFYASSVNMILGPNGSGKTLLFQCILGLLKNSKGEIRSQNRKLKDIPPMELARLISWVPSQSEVNFPFTAEEVILMGRYPYHQGYPRPDDFKYVDQSIRDLEIEHLKYQKYYTLSQGEKAKVQIARVIGSKASIMIFDEICANLDPKNTFKILDLLKSLAKKENKTIILSHHDLYTVTGYADYITMIKNGKTVTHGTTLECFTPESIQKTFEIEAEFNRKGNEFNLNLRGVLNTLKQ